MSDRRVAAVAGVLVFATCAYFFGGGGWNQNAQFALTRAIVERQTIAIDAYRDATNDVSFSGGHVYANKAPGVSFLAVIPYAAIYAVERAAGIDTSDTQVVTLNAWLCTAIVCGGSASLIAVLLFVAARRAGVPSGRAALVAVVAVIGTPILTYATMLYAHVPSALLLLIAFLCARERPLLAGLAAGAAVMTNYLCAPAAVIVGLWGAGVPSASAGHPARQAAPGETPGARGRDARPPLLFLLGALAPLALLASYHYTAFGSVFATAIDTMDRRFVDDRALFGIFRLPSAEAAWGITFSPYRGLFFLSPFLLLAFRVWRRPDRQAAIIAAIAAYFLVANASFNGWHGGWAIGPRYLIPVIPLLALLIVRDAFGAVAKALAAISVVLILLVTAVDPQPSHRIANPLTQWELPLLARGQVGVNRQTMDQVRAFVKYPLGSPEAEWASFNIGELLVRGPLSLVPLLVLLAAGGAWLRWRTLSS